jgi:hypothetical protein
VDAFAPVGREVDPSRRTSRRDDPSTTQNNNRQRTTEEDDVATLEYDLTEDLIAQRAYEISQSAECGSDEENWWRAEHELRLQTPTVTAVRPRRRSAKAAKETLAEKPAKSRTGKRAASDPGA